MSKPSIGRMGLALLLLYGIVPFTVGYGLLREWEQHGPRWLSVARSFS